MRHLLGLGLLFAFTTPALAQTGPGLGNPSYSPAEIFTPVGFIESPEGHGNVTMVQGYLMVIYSSDGGGRETDGGIEFWDISNPRAPVLVRQYDNAETHGLREAHGFSLAWYDDRLLLAAQGITGIQIWDVTDPMNILLLNYLDLPGIDRGDYSGDWWLFWQAPYVYVAGVDSGLYVVDASNPAQPTLAAQVPTGDLGGVSPAQAFALGNLLVVMESQGRGFASLDIALPEQPRLLESYTGRSGYSHLLAGDGKILTSGNIPPQAHFHQLTHDGSFSYLDTTGLFFDSGGYGSYQDGFFHSGFSDNYVKFSMSPAEVVDTGSSGRPDRDEDFSTVLGNIAFVGNDHGTGTALIPHQEAPDTTPPVVEWMHPAEGSAGIALTSRVGLSFSDHIDAASLGPTTIWLEDANGARVPTRLSAQMGLVNLSPLDDLALLQTYKVVAEGVRDVAGNPSPRFEASFTTGDGSLPMSPTAAVTNVDVNIAIGSYALGVFAEGKEVYSDRDYTFTAAFPPRFDGQAYIQTANVDSFNFLSDFLSFELLAPAEVLVLYDARASSIPNWMSGFSPTGETVVTTDTTLDVYSRDFPIGPVNLGGNRALGSDGAESMYSVVIIPEPVPCEVDLSPVETGTITLTGTGPNSASFEWRVGNQTFQTQSPSVYLAPGRYGVRLTVDNGVLGATCGGVKIVHNPIAPVPARVANRIIWQNGQSYNVNPDHGSVTRADPVLGRVVWERLIEGRPETLAISSQGELWVVDGEGARVVVLDDDTGNVLRSIALPRASKPRSLVFDPSGLAFVTLSATGEVIALDDAGTIVARREVVPTAHGLTWFDDELYVTRFISPDTHGEVHVLNASTLETVRVIELGFDLGPDTEATGRGVPNYVAEVQISPDGLRGFVASKKDNIARGLFRDGEALTFESRVRAIVSRFELGASTDDLGARMDVNDRDMLLSTISSPYGDLLFVLSQGANTIDVFDTATGERVSQFEVGLAPQGMAIDPAGRTLAVFNFLSRSVSYYDVTSLLSGTSNAVEELGEVTAVASEVLSPEVLDGKRIFFNAADPRMSRDSYISCASCHFEGGHDGRVWDFTQAGEGLRNTIPLNGRAGLGHGRVHWTANFDEIQDFENDIRNAFGGSGFLSDADFAATLDPLGMSKAGRSIELDALAAYVGTLDTFSASPHRAADGTLTAEARRGREVFVASGCASCHSGAAFSDFIRHDVGTIRVSSGQGIGAPLDGVGFETPTLLGVWESAPYLHDGSAPTLDLVLDIHTEVPSLAAEDRAALIAYLLELDGDSLAPELPCDTGPNECVGGEEPEPMEPDPADPNDPNDPMPVDPTMASDAGCSCRAEAGSSPNLSGLLILLVFVSRILGTRRAPRRLPGTRA